MDQILKKLHFRNLINLHYFITVSGILLLLFIKKLINKILQMLGLLLKIIKLTFLSDNFWLYQEIFTQSGKGSVEWMKRYLSFWVSEYLPKDDPVFLTNLQSNVYIFSRRNSTRNVYLNSALSRQFRYFNYVMLRFLMKNFHNHYNFKEGS
jgi:hypothetical protein